MEHTLNYSSLFLNITIFKKNNVKIMFQNKNLLHFSNILINIQQNQHYSMKKWKKDEFYKKCKKKMNIRYK